MKFAEMEIIKLKSDVITTSGNACPCFDPMTPGSENCPYDE